MVEINLLDTYPRIKRPIQERAAWKARSEENRAIAKRFAKEYFDGTREQGYGGYYYDGRWQAVAKRMIEYYNLKPDARVLDIGCAKGFLLHDFKLLLPDLFVCGIDISKYALQHVMEDVKPFCFLANAKDLPFPDKSFDLVISINVVHNLPFEECSKAIKEMERVSRKYKYLQVDSWRTEEERINFLNWQLTAQTYFDTEGWKKFFTEIGYTGDYYWTITE